MAVTATATATSATITTAATTVIATAVSRDAIAVTMSPNATDSTVSVYSNSASALLTNAISAADDNNDDAKESGAVAVFAKTSTANSKPLNVLNESTSIPFSPINELTIGLKRTLSDELLVSDNIKKSKLTVDNSSSNGKIEVPTLINTNNLKDKDIVVLNRKLKNINTIKESCNLIKTYDLSVSNEIPKNNNVTDISDNQNDNDINDISSNNHNVYSPSKKSICKKVGDVNQSSNTNNNTSIPQVKIISNQTIEDSENDDINDNSSLLNSSYSDKLVIVENSDHEDDADNISQLTDIIVPNVNETSKTESVQDNLPEHIHSPLRTKNQHEHLTAGEEDKFSDDNDFEVIDSDSVSNEATEQNIVIDEKLASDVLNGINQTSDDNFQKMLKCFNEKSMTFAQFESICTQKMLEVLTEKLGHGKHRKELQMILEREKVWRSKFTSLNRQCKELKTIVNMHVNDLKTNPNARPHIITRTVGLQAVLFPKKDSSVQSPKANIATTSKQHHEQPSEAIDITSDEENDVIVLDKINPKPSCSKNVKCATNTTPIKQKTSITKEVPINVPMKSVPPSVPIVHEDTCTIDLTEDDNIEVSNGVSLDKSPIKIVRHTTLNAGVSPGTLPAQLTTKPPHILPKNITYIELPSLSNCNSSYIVRTASPIMASNLVQQPVNVGQTLKPVQVGSTLKSVQVQRHSLNPVMKSVKPGVTFTTHQISASKSNGQLQPVPPAIPIQKHPAPLPPLTIQKSVPTSKKIPPAPRMTLAKSPDTKALVLSWNMSLNQSHAEISGYQIFAYKETSSDIPRSDLWKEIGNVNALPLPMACSLTKFVAGERYHFAVRAKDVYCRVGPFSSPSSIYLTF